MRRNVQLRTYLCFLQKKTWQRKSPLLAAKGVIAALMATLLLGMPSKSAAQTTAPVSGQPHSAAMGQDANPVPVAHLYLQFFSADAYLEKEADRLQQKGQYEQARLIRKHLLSHLQRDLRFTNAQAAIVHSCGARILQDRKDIWDRAMPIMENDRQWLKVNGRLAGPPPGHSQVHEFQTELETLLTNDVTQLNQELGSDAAARLLIYIGTHVSARVIHPPRLIMNPDKGSDHASQYLHQEAR